MQLVFDINVLVDVILQRGEDYPRTEALLEDVRSGSYLGWVSAYAIPTIVYLVERQLTADGGADSDTHEVACQATLEILRHLQVLPLPGAHYIEVLSDSPIDFEDRLVAQAAAKYLSNPVIISRDKKFDSLSAPVVHPREFDEFKNRDNAVAATARIEFIDLKEQQFLIHNDIESRLYEVLRNGYYILGPEVRELEGKLAEFVGCKHAISCASGTDALLMALMALDVGPGDAVFAPTFTFVATAEVISLLGARPVFVDIDDQTFNIDPKSLIEAIEKVRARGVHRPRCIIPVDLFGLPADYEALNEVANNCSLTIVEDAAQSFGATWKGYRTCGLGHIAATSFFPAKPLGCYGDGGAVFTDDDDHARKLLSIRVHGQGTDKYHNVRIGLNGRLDTVQAAVLLAKLEVFPGELEARARLATEYTRLLRKAKDGIQCPAVPSGHTSAWAQYSILTDDRDQLRDQLEQHGIPTAVYYPTPLHLQPAFTYLGYKQGDFPVAEAVSRRIFSLPMHPYLTASTQKRVIDTLLA